MNEKFFDLKKEKQDRIINAALKIFAKNGYRHASTDDIVVEAGISKGLLFHYFGSKIGLYSFLYNYCGKFLEMELKTCVSEAETDYFTIIAAMESAKVDAIHNYPYLQMFIDKSQNEEAEEAVDETLEMRSDLQSTYDRLLGQVDPSLFVDNVEPLAIHTMLTYTLRGIMSEQLQMPDFSADSYRKEAIAYIDMLKGICHI